MVIGDIPFLQGYLQQCLIKTGLAIGFTIWNQKIKVNFLTCRQFLFFSNKNINTSNFNKTMVIKPWKIEADLLKGQINKRKCKDNEKISETFFLRTKQVDPIPT